MLKIKNWLQQNWPSLFLSLILISGSFNLFFKYYYPQVYVQGWLVDYLLPKFYLSDIFILLFLLLTALEIILKQSPQPSKVKHKPSPPVSQSKNIFSITITTLIILSLIFIGRQFLTPLPLAALYSLIKIIEFSLFASALFWHRQRFSSAVLFWTLSALILGQSMLSFYQFRAQKPLFPYYVLGETNLASPAGLAKINPSGLFPAQIIPPHRASLPVAPYGSFPHPNILAGWITLSFLICFYLWPQIYSQIKQYSRYRKKITLTCLALTTVLAIFTLFLTQSWSAWLTLILGFIWLSLPFTKGPSSHHPQYLTQRWWLKHASTLFLIWVGAALFLIPSLTIIATSFSPYTLSLTRRADLLTSAYHEFSAHPWWGTGLNQFVPLLPFFGSAPITFHQPVHHTPILIITEIGLFGLILFSLFICLFIYLHFIFSQKESSVHENYPITITWQNFIPLLFILTPILTLDHYLITTQAGQIITLIFCLTLTHKTASTDN